jgi:4'-phosphopantetheinyl transferase
VTAETHRLPPGSAGPFAGTELWLADLASCGPALQAIEEARSLLPPECAAWDRNRRLAHIALRLLIARSGTNARGLPFAVSNAGKPSLPGAAHFSLSHTGDYALIGLSRAGPLGVDVEIEGRTVRMSEERRERLRAAGARLAIGPLAPGAAGLLQAFVRMEAFAKAEGSGLARLLGTLGVLGRGTSTAANPDLAAFAVGDLRLGHGLIGAVALPRGVPAPKPALLPADRAEIERVAAG